MLFYSVYLKLFIIWLRHNGSLKKCFSLSAIVLESLTSRDEEKF